MDIFTTALAQIRSNPIKPEKLRVKALRKEAATNELTDDIDHLEDHQLFFVDEKTHRQQKQQQQQTPEQKTKSTLATSNQDVAASDDVIVHKQDILHPHSSHDDDEDQDIKHLDIYI